MTPPAQGVRGAREAKLPSRLASRLAAFALKLPVHAYRLTFKPLVGHNCRHLPTCSEYALEAIDTNGAWRGGWLAASRICRCHPWGSSGYDPVPDVRSERHLLTPWRYGRWSRKTGGGAERDGLGESR